MLVFLFFTRRIWFSSVVLQCVAESCMLIPSYMSDTSLLEFMCCVVLKSSFFLPLSFQVAGDNELSVHIVGQQKCLCYRRTVCWLCLPAFELSKAHFGGTFVGFYVFVFSFNN
ncbi:unnamed protein product [Musa textilis]